MLSAIRGNSSQNVAVCIGLFQIRLNGVEGEVNHLNAFSK